MPFGLRNAAQTFQRLMDEVMQQLPGVFVYLDDVLVASSSPAEHVCHLRQLFEALRKFGRQELDFLGHHVTSSGIRPLAEKLRAVQKYKAPKIVKSLQRFLGMLNFYRRFLPNIAAMLRPLTDALAGKPRALTWMSQMMSAFQEAKLRLAHATLLAHPRRQAPLCLRPDASERAIAGCASPSGRQPGAAPCFLQPKNDSCRVALQRL